MHQTDNATYILKYILKAHSGLAHLLVQLTTERCIDCQVIVRGEAYCSGELLVMNLWLGPEG